jgi:tetratricopeptide (TPR) repeat protein
MKKGEEQKKVSEKLSTGKIYLFRVIAISLPILFFILFELFLSLAGYGYDLSLFKEYTKDSRFLVLNDKIGLKYFSNEEDTRVGAHEIFLKEKTDNTYRIFILGASSSYGFPYNLTTTFNRSIKYQLMHLFPYINFEVINLSITAVNSYTLVDFAKKLEDYNPDMILVYAGHNEYYGALGVGSTSKVGQNRKFIQFVLKTRHLKLTQLFRNMFMKINANKPDAELRESKPLMERMAAMQSIPFNSSAYHQGIKQYHDNMDELCSIFSDLDIPVLFSTIVSNEKDLIPLRSLETQKDSSANYQYELANKAYSEGDFALAKQKYALAKELDILRFRAPAQINETIKLLCEKYDNVYLVDAEELVRNQNEHNIMGKQVILEHVHPNLFGHRLISFAYIETLKNNQLISENWPSEEALTSIKKQIPYTLVDSIRAEYITVMMKEGWPFYIPIPEDYKFGGSFEEDLAYEFSKLNVTWTEMTNQLRQHYYKNRNFIELRKLLELQSTVDSYNADINMDAGGVNGVLNNHQKAAYYFKRAYTLKPDTTNAFNLAVTYLKLDKPEKAITLLEFMAQQNSNVGANSIELIQPIIDLKRELNKDEDNTSLMTQIAENYIAINHPENALKYLNMALEIDNSCSSCKELLKQVTN